MDPQKFWQALFFVLLPSPKPKGPIVADLKLKDFINVSIQPLHSTLLSTNMFNAIQGLTLSTFVLDL